MTNERTEAQPLQDLYRQTVLEHSRHPRNLRRLAEADRTAQGHNPLCGDKVTVYLRLDNDHIADIAFEGSGCAISMASASIMTEALTGKAVPEAKRRLDEIVRQFESRADDAPPIDGEMAALGGVRAYPSRIKCATLAWKALAAAFGNQHATVTTE
jgi:nitrogen fixation NifU-like protein